MENEDFLIQQCRTGNQKVLLEIYRQYYRQVYATCLRLTNVPADAEDLMQNSFIDAFTRIADYKGPSAFGGWLKRIAVNNCIDFIKRRRIHTIDLSETDDLVTEDEQDAFIEIELKVAQIKKAMAEITEDYRIILSLYFFEGYDQQEISYILKLSDTNVRTRLLRAKHALAKQLTQYQKVNTGFNSF